MNIFTSVQAARRFGFHWLEYRPDLGLHVVVLDTVRGDGLRQRALAFARPDEER